MRPEWYLSCLTIYWVKTLRIINQIADQPLWVSADAQRLEQVLYNLIGNAIKYTSEGKIVISATPMEHQVRVQVVDTGQGIPAEQLEHILNRSFKPGTIAVVIVKVRV